MQNEMKNDIVLEEEKALSSDQDNDLFDDAPDHFYCPISLNIMTNPVIANDGHAYEKAMIEDWLKNMDTSPVTGDRLKHKNLTPNYSLKSAIDEYKKRKLNPSIYKKNDIPINSQYSKPRTQSQEFFNSAEREKICARTIALFVKDLLSYVTLHYTQDNTVGEEDVYDYVYDTLEFLTMPPQDELTLEKHLLDNEVPKKIIPYIQHYLSDNDNIKYVQENDKFYQSMASALINGNINKIKFKGGLIDEDPDQLNPNDDSCCTSSFAWK